MIPLDEHTDHGEVYDPFSVMHYEGWSFLTEAASAAGLASIVHKGTNDMVLIDPPHMSGNDGVQLAQRYEEFCSPPQKIRCFPNDPNDESYILAYNQCNGKADCADGSYESITACGHKGCGTRLEVSGMNGDLDGIYDMAPEYENNVPYYVKEDRLYIYKAPNNNWHIGRTLGVNSAFQWTGAADCPSGENYFEWDSTVNSWVESNLVVTCLDCDQEPTDPPVTTPVTTTAPIVTETTTRTTTTTDTDPETTPSDDVTADYCANDGHVDFYTKAKRGAILRRGDKMVMMRMRVPAVAEDTEYSGVMIWGKKNCGLDFIEKLNNGWISVAVADQQSQYTLKYWSNYGENQHKNVAFQYNTKLSADNPCVGVNCLGNHKKDFFELYMIFHDGIDSINWGNKDPETCMASLRSGHLGAQNNPVLDEEDKTPCVSWLTKFW